MAEKPNNQTQTAAGTSTSSSTGQEGAEKQAAQPSTPRDVLLMRNILASAGIYDYDPRLISQMIEFSYAHTQNIMTEAKAISDYTGKKIVDEADVQFSLSASADKRFKNEEKRKKLMNELASQKNIVPLPAIKQMSGLRLPNDRFCLMNPSYVWHNTNQDNSSESQKRDYNKHASTSSLSADKVMRMLHTQNPLKRKPESPIEEEYD
uniref:Transcription initiation factor TFIID subunit 9 n=1 Tax=Steinernema glaseri TaxID=37863 RepID=A0A1I7YY47_9BILA